MLLPATDLPALVLLCKDQIGLDPRDAAAGKDQQIGDPVGIDAAVFVQLFSALHRDGLDPTLYGDAMGTPEKIERLFIPQIDARLQADLDPALRQSLQQQSN